MGSEPVTLTSSLPFCHRFNYGNQISAGTSFDSGESKVFNLNGLNSQDSDLWLYRTGSFGSPSAIVSGLKWGAASSVGRMSVAASAGIWPNTAAFAAPPAAGESLQMTGPDPFSPENWTSGPPNLGSVKLPEPSPISLIVTIENLAPENGTYLTPPWVGFHDGSFDSNDSGSPASAGLERIAEDGNPSALAEEFAGSGTGSLGSVLDGIGPIAPGASVSKIVTVDANSPMSRFLSYASMIIPSNDAFVANEDPQAHRIFDDSGQFVGAEFEILGSAVSDAGSEVNDELPANTAFFGQAAPNTGANENGVVMIHSGFNAAGQGGILDDSMFGASNFKAAGYQIARVKVEHVNPSPVSLKVTLTNLAPDNGTYLTPPWVGFHDGGFDSNDSGAPASAGLERIAEDGNPSVLAEEFGSSGAGSLGSVLDGIGPIAPGASVSKIVTVDANSPMSRFFSYASMIIPSNDAFVANDDPQAHRVFDDGGQFVGAEFEILGSAVNDSGTEVNDEQPVNTAFFGQASPDTGVNENGVVMIHSGFNAAGLGGILDDPMFGASNFKAAGYQIARVKVEHVNPSPVSLKVTLTNLAPDNGTYLTPPWVGFHDGGFDSNDSGAPASAGLERIAEDGNPSVLAEEFGSSGAGSLGSVLDGIGPIAPGASVSKIVTVDANSPMSRFFSYASMIIPSNDAFVANDDPQAHRVFDDGGQFVGADFEILGSAVNDSGTEVNDELPVNTAFFGQATPDTGANESGVVMIHSGFNAAGLGGILNDPMFGAADFNAAGYQIARVTVEHVNPNPVSLKVTLTNLAPDNGTYLTPPWVGFHDGGFDSNDSGAPASAGLERIAEDGNPSVLAEEFGSSGAGSLGSVLDGIGPIAPGASVSKIVTVDANSPMSRFFSYASMIIPSNDAFVANDDPQAHRVFDDGGQFVGAEFEILGSAVNDSGTEVNDEQPVNTAFFGQASPDTGVNENGVVMIHSGFNAAGQGGILDDSMFGAADFKAAGYQIARLTVEPAEPNPVSVSITLANTAPENGVFLTPIWIGFHDGTFDLIDPGTPASSAIERLAEDGNTGPLSESFLASGAGDIESTVASGGAAPVFAPGATRTVTFSLDANNPKHRYLSFASMVIPSNDAFIANSDPKAHPMFDSEGQFIGLSILELGSEVYDAGTEVNDELPANTAFFGQMAPNTGIDENGLVRIHAGFRSEGEGGVLDDPMFANSDFSDERYPILSFDPALALVITQTQVSENQVSIDWTGGRAPYQVQWRPSLTEGQWLDAGQPTEASSISVELTAPLGFFRVISVAEDAPATAQYEVTFNATWSASTHPTDFPSNSHFSGLIGGTHNSQASFWEPGGTASAGMENMAETGGKSPLDSEIMTAIAIGTAENMLSGDGINPSPESVSLAFEISQEYPLVSLVSMIAPSPDWFVGVHGLSLFENGMWADEIVISLDAYDAGTDDGATYTSPDADSNPRGVITRLAGGPLTVNGSVPALGTFTFRRLD